MSVRPLRYLGDPVLRMPCDPVTDFGPSLQQLVDDLLDSVQEPGRAGLAAPQIGVGLRAFSYFVDGALGHVVNPRIVDTAGVYDGTEGCLSIPGVHDDRRRAMHVVCAGQDRDGNALTVEGSGELARALQHETDHLDGVLWYDALTGDARKRVLREIRERGL